MKEEKFEYTDVSEDRFVIRGEYKDYKFRFEFLGFAFTVFQEPYLP